MSFCVKCGTKSIDESAKFCHKCGASLVHENDEPIVSDNIGVAGLETIPKDQAKATQPDIDESLQSEQRRSRAYELGVALEDAVEDILKAEGYSTEKRQRLSGKKGTSEIDIIATKVRKGNKEVIAVECKNYSSPVPVKEVRDFIGKLEDLDIKNGLFAARPDFSSEAAQWGQNHGLQLWSEDVLKEKYFEINIGRLGTKEPGKLKYYLPLKVGYDEAVDLKFENKEKVEIESAKLIWKPFYKLSFRLKCTRTDPIRQKHIIEDSGYYIVDALSGTIPEHSDFIKNVLNQFIGQTKEVSHQIKEIDILLKELEQKPDSDLNLEQAHEYKTIIHKPLVTEEKATRIALNGIVEDNTQTVYYKFKKDEDDLFAPDREFTIAPSAKDIRILSIELVHVPKWELEFKSKEFKYIKKITGNTGAIIYDTVTNCNKHWLTLFANKKNVAICDVCGEALCKEHIWKCPTCGSWRCETHSLACTSCQKSYCPEHILNKCAKCHNAICELCSFKCPICGDTYCKKHITKCSKCARIVCISCTRKEGGILSIGQKVYCKNC
jgi:hypothetical protein